MPKLSETMSSMLTYMVELNKSKKPKFIWDFSGYLKPTDINGDECTIEKASVIRLSVGGAYLHSICYGGESCIGDYFIGRQCTAVLLDSIVKGKLRLDEISYLNKSYPTKSLIILDRIMNEFNWLKINNEWMEIWGDVSFHRYMMQRIKLLQEDGL